MSIGSPAVSEEHSSKVSVIAELDFTAGFLPSRDLLFPLGRRKGMQLIVWLLHPHHRVVSGEMIRGRSSLFGYFLRIVVFFGGSHLLAEPASRRSFT
jgi:hypothetical protein